MTRSASPSGRGDEREEASPDARQESVAQRDDRNLAELVQELRVVGPVPGAAITAVLACMLGGLWFAVPLAQRRDRLLSGLAAIWPESDMS